MEKLIPLSNCAFVKVFILPEKSTFVNDVLFAILVVVVPDVYETLVNFVSRGAIFSNVCPTSYMTELYVNFWFPVTLILVKLMLLEEESSNSIVFAGLLIVPFLIMKLPDKSIVSLK